MCIGAVPLLKHVDFHLKPSMHSATGAHTFYSVKIQRRPYEICNKLNAIVAHFFYNSGGEMLYSR